MAIQNHTTAKFSDYLILLKKWVLKGGLGILDQMFSSGANFLLSVLLGRWFGIREYGVYAFATAFLSLFYQVQNALVMEPMSVIGPSTYPDQIPAYLAKQQRIHFIVFIPLGLIISISSIIYNALGGASDTARILVLLGLFASLIQLPWVIRRSFYVLNQPGKAVIYSFIYNIVLVGLLFLLHTLGWLSTSGSFVLMAVAAVIAVLAVRLVNKNSSRSQLDQPIKKLWAQNWDYGKWMLLTGGLIALASQSPIYLAGLLIDTDASGVMKVLLNFIQPMIMSVSAFAALAIPNFSRDFGKGDNQALLQKKRVITAVVFGLAGIYELLLLFFAVPLEQLIYEGRYAGYMYLVPLWGLIPMLNALALGPSVHIRAIQKPQGILGVTLIWVLVSFLTGFVFIRQWGYLGATISAVTGYAVFCIAYFMVARLLIPNKK